ncbi:MAG: hypothetical protein HY909_16155 [Deltaproteobacteria bacterium]|nr:hypothetical protein [Deltaproteobacteria bacterium]
MSGQGQGGWGPPGGFGPPGGGPPGGFGPPGGGGPPGGFGPPGGGGPPGGFGPPGGGGFGPPGGGGFGPPGGGGFGPPGGGPYGPPGGGAFGPPGGGPPGFGPPGYGPPGGMPQPPPSGGGNKGLLIGLGVAALLVVCGVCVVGAYLHDKKTQSTYGALTAACEGRAVAGTTAYTPGPATHRVVGAERASNGTWRISNSRIPSGQVPTGVSDTEVVACFGEATEVQIGTCEVWRTRNGIRVPGTVRTYPRMQSMLPVRLVSAQTGQQVMQGSVAGPMPRNCEGPFGPNPTASTFRGSTAGSTEVGPWLNAVLSGNNNSMVPLP